MSGDSGPRRKTLHGIFAHQVVTDQSARFTSEGGKAVERLLFCEFIDNSINALLRQQSLHVGSSAQTLSPIEVHLFYDFNPRRYHDNGRPLRELSHIAVFDCGPGLDKDALKGWTEHGKPTGERDGRDAGAPALAERIGRDPPNLHADGQLGIFGKGSKSAGFGYGVCVRIVTRAFGGSKMSEMVLEKEQMADAGDKWQTRTYDEWSLGDWASQRSHFEKSCPPLMDLYKRAAQTPHFAPSLLSTKIDDGVARALHQCVLPTVACELRDMYCVYLGVLHEKARAVQRPSHTISRLLTPPPHAFSRRLLTPPSHAAFSRLLTPFPAFSQFDALPKKEEAEGLEPPPAADFKYGTLDVRIFAHFQTTGGSGTWSHSV